MMMMMMVMMMIAIVCAYVFSHTLFPLLQNSHHCVGVGKLFLECHPLFFFVFVFVCLCVCVCVCV